MYALEVEGIPVLFPFEPYDVQRDYMAAVMRSFLGKTHGALESPTGTGKTLCLLCASCVWLVWSKNDHPSPRIIYSTRVQVTQVIKEFKTTA